MTVIPESIARFVAEEDGASATEYAILVAVVASTILVAAKLFSLGDVFGVASSKAQNCVNAGVSGGNC